MGRRRPREPACEPWRVPEGPRGPRAGHAEGSASGQWSRKRLAPAPERSCARFLGASSAPRAGACHATCLGTGAVHVGARLCRWAPPALSPGPPRRGPSLKQGAKSAEFRPLAEAIQRLVKVAGEVARVPGWRRATRLQAGLSRSCLGPRARGRSHLCSRPLWVSRPGEAGVG